MKKEIINIRPKELNILSVNPLVTIIVANYNYSKYIGQCIESVMLQTYKNIELIICDDGSTDDSVDVISKYLMIDSRIKLVCQNNKGQAAALNMAYSSIRGEIVAILDADDLYEKTKIEEVVKVFKNNNTIGLCTHKVQPIDDIGNLILKPLPKHLDTGWLLNKSFDTGGCSAFGPASGLTFRTEVTNRIFPLDERLSSNADTIIAELAQYITIVGSIDKPLSKFRLHSENLTSQYYDFPNKKLLIKGRNIHILYEIAHKEFLTNSYCAEIACLYSIEKRPGYWDEILALRIFDKYFFNINNLKIILKNIKGIKRRLLWLVIFMSFSTIRIKLLKYWWSIRK